MGSFTAVVIRRCLPRAFVINCLIVEVISWSLSGVFVVRCLLGKAVVSCSLSRFL